MALLFVTTALTCWKHGQKLGANAWDIQHSCSSRFGPDMQTALGCRVVHKEDPQARKVKRSQGVVGSIAAWA